MVQLLIRNPKARSCRNQLKALAGKILKELGKPDAELSVVITDDGEIQALNREYRGIDRVTDVLSFSQVEGEGPVQENDLLGDVVISWEQAERQAGELGHGTSEELARLLVHGVLHLFGFKHVGCSEEEAERMRRMEDRLLGIREEAGT